MTAAPQHPWRYGAAVAVVALATAATALVQNADDAAFFPFYVVAIAAAAAIGGLGPGLVALALSALSALLLFVGSTGAGGADGDAALRLGMFTAAGALLVVLAAQVRRSERAARAAREQVERFVAASPVGLAFVDADLRLTHVNAPLAALAAAEPAALLGRPAREALPDPLGTELDSGLRRALAGAGAEVELEALHDGRRRSWRATFYAVPAAEGPAGAGVVLADVTARRAIEERARLLAEASGLLASPLSFGERLDLLVRVVVPSVADAAIFEVPEPAGAPSTVALGHRDPAGEAVLRAVRGELPLPGRTGPDSARAGEVHAELDLRASGVDLAAGVQDAGLREAADSLDLRSYVVVPLVARGRRMGTLTMLTAGERRLQPEDVPLAEELGRRAALALDNARLLERQTEIAHTLQQSLLPSRLPAIDGAELAVRYRPAGEALEVGGDFYDAFPTPWGWLLSIGDVCGKGPLAATTTSLARHTIRALALDGRSAADVLRGLNEALVQESARPTFLTCALVALRLHGDALRATVSTAGHPPPLLLRASGEVEPLGAPGTLVGPFVEELRFGEREAALGPGDALVLYTDGVLEARSSAGFFGDERLRALLGSSAGRDAHALADRIEHEVAEFQQGAPTDDLAVVVLRFVGVGAAAQAPSR